MAVNKSFRRLREKAKSNLNRRVSKIFIIEDFKNLTFDKFTAFKAASLISLSSIALIWTLEHWTLSTRPIKNFFILGRERLTNFQLEIKSKVLLTSIDLDDKNKQTALGWIYLILPSFSGWGCHYKFPR